MSITDNIAILENDDAAAEADKKFAGYILNCVPSQKTEKDWGLVDGADGQLLDFTQPVPDAVDLRESWWTIRDQGQTGACVGFATADSVLRWHYVRRGLIGRNDLPSPRFVWMANKETDGITGYPTSFLEMAGSSTRDALSVVKNYGCILEEELPMSNGYPLSRSNVIDFYSNAAPLRIHHYRNLYQNTVDPIAQLKRWIAQRGPILTRLDVDQSWLSATSSNGRLDNYIPISNGGGHAVALVGYTANHFVVRNSWGTSWGDAGFAYASNAYAKAAFDEAYGVVI